jgi:uncharacterized membrane protein YuzA (DUF378 family)
MTIHAMVATAAYILVVIGALNWGLVGAFGIDLVARVFGPMSMAARIIYIVIGVAALYLLFLML